MPAGQVGKNKNPGFLSSTRDPEMKQALVDNGADQVCIDDGTVKARVRKIYPYGVNKIL
jgi:hypothetical protein